jgi:hypothetical protein
MFLSMVVGPGQGQYYAIDTSHSRTKRMRN